MPKGGKRPGAGRPPIEGQGKESFFYIRVIPAEKEAIKSYCSDHHISISKLARDCIFEKIRAEEAREEAPEED